MNRFTTMATALLALGSLLTIKPAAAQQQKKGEKTTAPPSFSNQKPAPKPVALTPVTEEQGADAILGEALVAMYNQADAHYDKGEWNHTINLLEVISQGDPHNVNTYSEAAYLLWSSDRNDLAIEQLKLGIAANPKISYMYDELGTHYWIQMKDAVNAIPYYEKAILYPCGWTTFHNLAFCYQKLNQWDKAVATWKMATKYGDDPRAAALLKRAETQLAAHGGH